MKNTLLLLLLLAVLVSCNGNKQKEVPLQEIPVIKVKKQDLKMFTLFVGQVYGYKDIPIRARVEGYLEGIHFKEGSGVKKGQLLYTIDSQPFEAEVAANQSKLAEAKTMLIKAEAEYNRYKPLVKTNAVSKSDYDAVKAQYEAAIAAVEAAKARLRIANINLSYARIKSPIDGIIGKTMAKVGEFVGRDPNPVILNTVSRLDSIRVEFFISENQYLKLARYMINVDTVSMDMDTGERSKDRLQLVLSDGTLHKYRGHIDFIDRGVDSQTGAMLIQATFPNPDRLVRPGQYAKVKIEQDDGMVLALPQRCINEIQGSYSVYVVNKDNVIEPRIVVVGDKSVDMWEIKEGIKEGELVVIDAIQMVRKGQKVIPKETEFKSKANI
ncbi:MAG: efflux RND transporter periplasmic adaptor subunit [Chlorobi bacterium]|nr:efflux RND transporter periplasmic adaptor subunit [Chlorobiota bacterium]